MVVIKPYWLNFSWNIFVRVRSFLVKATGNVHSGCDTSDLLLVFLLHLQVLLFSFWERVSFNDQYGRRSSVSFYLTVKSAVKTRPFKMLGAFRPLQPPLRQGYRTLCRSQLDAGIRQGLSWSVQVANCRVWRSSFRHLSSGERKSIREICLRSMDYGHEAEKIFSDSWGDLGVNEWI